ncbi:MAG: 4Fe-4S binding protein [Nitrospiraceae bacterium]|nr:4Fe-4S binding protein [Nitrospiraceae bacterium]
MLRYGVQAAFLLLTVFIGYRFHQFVLHFEVAGHPFVEKPPSVDAFLPIAGFMSFKYFLFTGIIEPMHPAAFVMFAAITGVSFLMKKGFCGWICPIGTVSQYLWMAGERVFGRNFRIEKYTDMALRSAKYMLMALFILLIGFAMAPNMMVLFFLSDYYKAADVKTMKFFTELSSAAMWFLIIAGGLSLIYKNVWCRYLCPYGALLGLLSSASPVKIKRDNGRCRHCSACTANCPGLLDVEKSDVVNSPECFGCLTCVSRCPEPGALAVTVRAGKGRRPFSPFIYPAILIVVFYLVIGAAMLGGKWHSQLPYEEYRRIIPASAELGHP